MGNLIVCEGPKEPIPTVMHRFKPSSSIGLQMIQIEQPNAHGLEVQPDG
jgi:hypothetical protein